MRSCSTANTNMLWGCVTAKTLSYLGVQYAVICPGSRSAPLAIGFSDNTDIRSISALDERSASFFALGRAIQCKKPVVIICSSGTAAANFYPAVIEASLSNVPLIILTADRPSELQGCHAPQSIDQIKLFGNYPRWQISMMNPCPDIKAFQYLRQSLMHAYMRAEYPHPGPVHLNFPFREPLAPIFDPDIEELCAVTTGKAFYQNVVSPKYFTTIAPSHSIKDEIQLLRSAKKGIFVIGPTIAQNPSTFATSVGAIAASLGWPTLTDALNPLRNFQDKNQYLICHYDTILRNKDLAQKLRPDCVLAIGALPTSKVLRAWLETADPITFLISPQPDNLDPCHRRVRRICLDLSAFEQSLLCTKTDLSQYCKSWLLYEEKTRLQIFNIMQHQDLILEAKIPWFLARNLPEKTPIHIANSTPIRDVEYFWPSNNRHIVPTFNRGTNGIDGTVSSGMGMAHYNQPSVLLTGDLSFLHDSNGLLINHEMKGSLTIVIINNNGGRIFESLFMPTSDILFERYFVTPQNIILSKFAEAHRIPCFQPQTWGRFLTLIAELPSSFSRIIVLNINNEKNTLFRKSMLDNVPRQLES